MNAYMEESLDLPLSSLLIRMQERIKNSTSYFGIKALRSPLDTWVYQELIHTMKPDVIIEIGNAYGGGTLSLAHLCDLSGSGRVIGIDITHSKIPAAVRNHPRITLLEGDACAMFKKVQSLIAPHEKILVIEDSSHTYENTLQVLRTYSPLTRPGEYFIVEDSICHHGLETGPKPGPYEAIETFVKENSEFEIDRSMESFLVTWNPKGFLRRKGKLAAADASAVVTVSASEEKKECTRIRQLLHDCIPPILIKLAKRLF